jgi:transcriptional antiterminator NusG
MSEIDKKWYVVRAISGKEKKVKELLELEISRNGLSDFVAQVLIPTEKVFQIRNGKKINKEKTYLPGYVLIEANLAGEVPHIIKNIPNVIGFLGTEKGGVPVAMRLAEVNRILGKVDELIENEEELRIPFVVGESVKVIDGRYQRREKEVESDGKNIWKEKLVGA